MDFRSLMPFSGSSLSRAGNGDPFMSLRREMDRMFDDFTRGWPAPSGMEQGGFLTPKVNVAETEKGLEVTADLPGVDPKDIQVDLTDGVLTLKAEHKSEKEEKDEAKRYHLVERSSGSYMRRFSLPFEADEDKIDASFEKGVLKISIPRSASAEKPAKKIEVRSA
ncbi:Hsp20/alpha crystallin family protein [Alsobacter soli]|uniref:Hsp20/alpha crystallin family protein n=2 Tax=Alsobacter soli TaxID=2109933 RepID=A0A2T1HZZ5_9HYPH|nr:Hsp20/alpha crystallin family protein [Alsobacter soli]